MSESRRPQEMIEDRVSIMTLDKLFYPRGVAVVGSVSEGKLGYHLIGQLVAGGFERVYAVNPRGQGLGPVAGYKEVSAVPGPVDLVVVASPAGAVPGILADSGSAGVQAAVIISAGFAEAGNAAGEAEITEVARRLGVRVVGPNCAGIINTACCLYATLEARPPAGAAALVSQSGALGGAVLGWAQEQGLGFSKFISYGNRADVGEAEILRYLAADSETRVVALYIESVADGRDFIDALAECTREKPVVVIKAGRSGAGQRATLSHTGSLAGADEVYDAALRASGAVRVASIEELFDVCKGFVSLPPVRGRRLAIVTNSGGPGVLAADRAEGLGLSLPEPSPAVRSRLAHLPAQCSLRNPIDLTVEGTEAGYRETLLAVFGASASSPGKSAQAPGGQAGFSAPGEAGVEGEYDAALAMDVGTPYLDSVALARGVSEAVRRLGKPVAVNFMAGSTVADAVAYLRSQGIPNFPTGERAATVLARMAEYEELRAKCMAGPARKVTTRGSRPAARREFWGTCLAVPSGLSPALLEHEAMAFLRDHGLPVPDHCLVVDPDGAVRAAHAIGYPVVVKVVSPGILHKSDSGGVVVGVRDDDGVISAFETVRRAAAGMDFRGALIYPMVEGAQEVLVGLSRDPQFGPVVACGLGGIYTEILHDVSLRIAPVDGDQAMAMILELRGAALLRGARGRPPGDLKALAEAIARLSELPFSYPEIKEIDLNPVFVLPHGVLAGDARIISSPKE